MKFFWPIITIKKISLTFACIAAGCLVDNYGLVKHDAPYWLDNQVEGSGPLPWHSDRRSI